MAKQHNEYNIKGVLKKCRQAANEGYKIASKQTNDLYRCLGEAEELIDEALEEFNTSSVYDSSATSLLEQQLHDVKNAFNNLSMDFDNHLNTLHKNLAKFSITLFGRTMAGKSTLMEFLIHGDGKTIGNGSQRTTRDIRTYKWNGLEVTDVPGIGAFKGQEDEMRAFDAANTADLILFLLTDDAPQAAEAEFFSRIIDLGKPILCIINVKTTINIDDDIELTLWDIDDHFDLDRLNALKNEFLAYGCQSWQDIPFIYVHLQAAFISQRTKDKKLSKSLYNASRIGFLKRQIIEQVRNKGEFFRIKTFIDIISVPTLEAEETLLKQSLLNKAQGRTILEKSRKLDNWRKKFHRDSLNQINSVITGIRSQLYSEIAAFAEEHFADENADKEWNNLVQDLGIVDKCQTLMGTFEEQANDEIREISREIIAELKFISLFTNDKELRMSKIIDIKKAWNWGALILSTALSLGTTISYLLGAALTGPLGWATLVVSVVGVIGSWFFKSRDTREYEARRKLEEALQKSVDTICKTLSSKMIKNLELLEAERVDKMIDELCKMNTVIFKLADTQIELAWKLNTRFLSLNKQLVAEAIKLIGAEGLEWWILEVARIPGRSILIQLDNGKWFPEEQKTKLHYLMLESIDFVYSSDNKKEFISSIMKEGIESCQINIEEETGIAHVSIPNEDLDIVNRARLAQQLSQLVITQ